MTDVEVPRRLRGRPRDHRGFLVPHFVAWFKSGAEVDERTAGAEPDFRVVSRVVLRECVRKRRCWLCGQPLGAYLVFVLGPMCAVSRTVSEPPSHRECAEFAVQACPFLARPRMRRNPSEYQMPVMPAAGEHLDRNPGVMALWTTRSYSTFDAFAGQPGVLFRVGEPTGVLWFREGRAATRAEIWAAISEGMPALQTMADADPDDPVSARAALAKCVVDLEAWLPRESVA